MRAKAKNKFWFNSREVNVGDIIEVDSTEGEKLIKYDLVKELKTKRTTKERKLKLSTKTSTSDGTSSRG